MLGATATVEQIESDLEYLARVDTGARLTSIHVEQFEVEDEAADVFENIGKSVRILLVNRAGQQRTIVTTILDVVIVKQSEGEEARYVVPLTLSVQGVQRRILVTLNDRSRMSYALLLGRNFIRGEFLVDVTLGDADPDVSLPEA